MNLGKHLFMLLLIQIILLWWTCSWATISRIKWTLIFQVALRIASFKIKDNFGWTALHFAVSCSTGSTKDDDILLQLLDFPGIQVDVSNNDSNIPLHYFCQKFSSPSYQKIGLLLIKPGESNFLFSH